jgi:hypothetical protein
LNKFENKLYEEAEHDSALMKRDHSNQPETSALTLIIQNKSQHGSEMGSDFPDQEKSFQFGCNGINNVRD